MLEVICGAQLCSLQPGPSNLEEGDTCKPGRVFYDLRLPTDSPMGAGTERRHGNALATNSAFVSGFWREKGYLQFCFSVIGLSHCT